MKKIIQIKKRHNKCFVDGRVKDSNCGHPKCKNTNNLINELAGIVRKSGSDG